MILPQRAEELVTRGRICYHTDTLSDRGGRDLRGDITPARVPGKERPCVFRKAISEQGEQELWLVRRLQLKIQQAFTYVRRESYARTRWNSSL